MDGFDVMGRIKELCASRSWTYYRLAKEADIPYSSLSTMLHKAYVPSIPSLIKICRGFDITLAQFFSEEDDTAKLSKKQKLCLERWDKLDEQSQALDLDYIEWLADRQNEK